MIAKILKKDILRNKIITVSLFIFILISSLLVSSAASIVMELIGSMNHLFDKSNAPHFVQMYYGEINQSDIDKFTSETNLISNQQTVELINIDGSSVFLDDSNIGEENSVMDISFVKQNQKFDYLLDLDSNVIDISEGEVAVPIYYMIEKNLNVGDIIRIKSGQFEMNFTIKNFVRDVQMNPSIVSSKRFVVNDNDWKILKDNIGESEYLIEFQLLDLSKLGEFENLYQSSHLPQNGTSITYYLYKTLNGLTDGIGVAIIILVSILLIAIAVLCLRFTMIATMEEDYREIGIMKAIGFSNKKIRELYLMKYIVMAGVASICGYIISLLLSQEFTSNITLYMGIAKKTVFNYIIPLIGAIIVFLIVVVFCYLVLKKFRHISAVEAIRTGKSSDIGLNKLYLKLHKNRLLNINYFIGIKDVISRFRVFCILCFVFIICSFIMIVPVNFLNTIESSNFVTYMGIGKSDIRIDLRQIMNVDKKFDEMIMYIQNDNEIEKYSALATSLYKIKEDNGKYKSIMIETGDFSIFPLKYINGKAPYLKNEIALSYMNAKEFDKEVEETISILVEGEEEVFKICGIYQDVTNGGKTAKAMIPYNKENLLWYMIDMNIKSNVDINEKILEYTTAFETAKVTYIEDYLSQTLGSTINQIRKITYLSVTIAIVLAILVTALFLKMLIAKDATQISIMRCLGFSYFDIRVQYVTKIILILLISIIIGTIAAGTIGQSLVSILMSNMGASSIKFTINYSVTYILCPLLMILTVTGTTVIVSSTIKKNKKLIMEI